MLSRALQVERIPLRVVRRVWVWLRRLPIVPEIFLFYVANFKTNIFWTNIEEIWKFDEYAQCISPVHHNPGPFPKLHQLRFKLFFLQLLFKTFWLFTFFSSLISFHAPVDHNAGPLPALGVHLERVLDVVVRVAVVPHHVRLQLVLQEKH